MSEEKTKQRALIEPGWYQNLSNEDYHGSAGFSSSQLKTLVEKTPAHLRYNMGHPKEASEAMNLGTAVHAICLEPDKFHDEFAVIPEKKRPTKTQLNAKTIKPEVQALADFWRGWDIATEKHIKITRNTYCIALRMAINIAEHPIAGLLIQDMIPESSVYQWYKSMDVHEETDYQLMLKVRPDIASKAYPVIADIKTTSDGSYSGFQRMMERFYYHLSAAMYLEICNQSKELLKATGNIAFTKFVMICVENFAPYLVSVYEVDAQYLEIGKLLYRRSIFTLHHGKNNDWPGYPEEIRILEAPSYSSRIHIV